MRKGSPFIAVLLMFAFVNPAMEVLAASKAPPLETVQSVDLSRYTGLWYEVARLPHSFENGCTGVTATYAMREDGRISVENRCRKGSLTAPETVAKGVARVVEPRTNAKLEVSFFWPFWGDYWILELGSEYEYAVVGAPNREYLWILSRTPKLSEQLLEGILARRAEQGFDVTRLEWTLQADER